MVMTNTERATLYSALADAIGQEEAETLMEQFPPWGWDQGATKDDIKVLGAGFAAAFAETNAALAAAFAETNAAITAGLAEANAAITAGLAEANAAITAGLAEANAAITAGLAETNAAMRAGFAEAATERAEIVKSLADVVRSQARQLYIITATIIAATVSIWIALFTSAGPG